MEHICPKCQYISAISPKLAWVESVCPKCFTVFNNENKAIHVLEKNIEVKKKFPFDLFEIVRIENKNYQLISIAIKQVDYLTMWTEYTFVHESSEIYLSECNGHWIKLKEVTKKINLFKLSSKTSLKTEVFFNGRPYDIYSKDNIEVKYAAGFFSHSNVGKKYELAEYINPPYMLSAEFRNKDYDLFHGQHIDEEYLKSLKSTISLPSKIGIGVVEPSKYDFFNNVSIFIYFSFFILFTFFVNSYISKNRQVFSVDMIVDADTAREIRSESFELKGASAPLTFELSSDNQNSWTATNIELVNEKTNESLFASKDVEYYSGYDGGEFWSEGDKDKEFSICGVAEGKYHLVLSNQKDNSDLSNHLIHINVKWDKPSFWNSGIALLFIILVGLLHYAISHYHDRNRWSNSDYDIYYEDEEY